MAEMATLNNGGCSSAVESWIVIPVVVGSNPIGRPKILKKASRLRGFFLLRNWDRGSAIRFFREQSDEIARMLAICVASSCPQGVIGGVDLADLAEGYR